MKISWGRIIIIGIAFEILFLLTLIVVVQGWLKYSQTDLELTFSLFIGVLLCGLWLGISVPSHQITHGSLVGLATVIVYLLISISAELAGKISIDYDFYYFINHAVKILGGALGGLIALNLSKRKAMSKLTS